MWRIDHRCDPASAEPIQQLQELTAQVHQLEEGLAQLTVQPTFAAALYNSIFSDSDK